MQTANVKCSIFGSNIELYKRFRNQNEDLVNYLRLNYRKYLILSNL